MSLLLSAWYRVEALAGRVLLAAVAAAPPALALGFARIVGRFVYLVWRRRRHIALDNLRQSGLARDEVEARRLARESFESFVLMVVESVILRRRLDASHWAEHVSLKLSPEAEAALREPGRGLIVASAHLGNWEVAARAVSQIKPVCVVYRPVNNPHLNAHLHAGRSGERLRLLSRLEPDPLRFLQALHQGEVLALMIDQHVHEGRVQVDFLGRPAWTSRSVAMLQFTTRAPLVVAVAVRTGTLRFEVHAVGPLRVPRTGDRERDVRDFLQSLTAEVERLVRLYPGQYMWGHRRWKPQ
ncbi:MAG: lysophospholipid acyltransferase family protein [Verrucomicrobiota bacterium]